MSEKHPAEIAIEEYTILEKYVAKAALIYATSAVSIQFGHPIPPCTSEVFHAQSIDQAIEIAQLTDDKCLLPGGSNAGLINDLKMALKFAKGFGK